MADIEQASAKYAEFFLTLTDDRVEGFRALATDTVRYRDPIMDERGIDNVIRAMHGWFAALSDIRFEMMSSAVSDQQAFQHWFMHFLIKKLPTRQWVIDGTSRINFDEDARVVHVQDYWDASPLLEAVPVFGLVPRLLKRLL